MTTFTEVVYISQFDIQPNGCISVRKTTDVLKDGVVISSTYWRTILVPNDSTASTVLDEAYYLNIANYAWSQPSPQPYVPPAPIQGV
jgi:archaellum component FlaF (FlaF/FlaG flagellin family)